MRHNDHGQRGNFMQDFARQMREFGRKQASAMREQARSTAMKRKEEYLGARVPKDLREKVIARADSLGIPVSILIRNILEDAFNTQVARGHAQTSLDGGASVGLNERFPNVIGWERITLNKDVACSSCSKILPAGSVAAWGVSGAREDRVILCEKCREST